MDISQSTTAISLIVPVYNCESFIEDCLKSVLSQTIASDIQYIFINDASTDNSLAIMQKIARSNAQLDIHIISHSTRKGSAFSRNEGINFSKGTYLMFADSDDWIDCDMAETLLNAATIHDADIATCAFYVNTPHKQRSILFDNNATGINVASSAIDVLHFSLCNKLIRRELIIGNHLFSQDGIDCWEDLTITSRALALAHKNIVINRPLYHYRKSGQTSLTSARQKAILNDRMANAVFIDSWFDAHQQDFGNMYSDFIIRLKFNAKIKMLRGETIEITRWKNTFPEVNDKIAVAAMQFNPIVRLAFWGLVLCPTSIAIATARLLGRNAQ